MKSSSKGQFSGYVPIPVLMNEEDLIFHFIYIKQDSRSDLNEENEEEDDDDNITLQNKRTLYITNIPIDTTRAHLRALFRSFSEGIVDEINFKTDEHYLQKRILQNFIDNSSSISSFTANDKSLKQTKDKSLVFRPIYPSGYYAHVRFVDQAALKSVLTSASNLWSKYLKIAPKLQNSNSTSGLAINKKIQNSNFPKWGEGIGAGNEIPDLGSIRYKSLHADTYGDSRFRKHLMENVNSYLSDFFQKEEELERKRLESGADDDGFITVSYKGSEEFVAPAKKRKQKEFNDFYRFQIRDQKKTKMNELLSKFKRDQERIAEMKARRKFKPT